MLVIDASLAVSAIADSGDSGRVARAVLSSGTPLHAPDVFDLEVTSALRRLWLAQRLERAHFDQAVQRLGSLPARRWPARPLLPRIVEFAGNVTTYDAAYLALAERLDAELVTLDRRLARVPTARCAIRVAA